jgi:ABC-type branched-subunit amino acid transport system substrate-binding protein
MASDTSKINFGGVHQIWSTPRATVTNRRMRAGGALVGAENAVTWGRKMERSLGSSVRHRSGRRQLPCMRARRVRGFAVKHESRKPADLLGETTVLITRCGAMLASAATLLGPSPLARPALAQSAPILIGWLAALTGPSSAPAIGFDRGVKFAADEINAAGGEKGRKVEIVMQPDVTPDMLRMKNSGAKVIVVWSVATGMLARLMNERGALGWDVPIVGHPALGSGDVRKLLEKETNWEKVYMVGYASCSYDANGKLPPRTDAFVTRLAGKVSLEDTSLWWVACGYDAIKLVAEAINATGSSVPDAILGYWNSLLVYPGVFGAYTWTPEQHNGYPTKDVVMSQANSQKDGAFKLAPGYA